MQLMVQNNIYLTVNCILDPPKILPLNFGAEVFNEGAFAQLSCIVTEGDEPLSISWSFHGASISSDLGIVTTPIGSRGSMLLISRVGHRHSGSYTCKASNNAGTESQTAVLNVNGKTLGQRKALEIAFS